MQTLVIFFLLIGTAFAVAPPAPKDLKVTEIKDSSFKLSWSASPGAYGYDVLGLPKLVRLYYTQNLNVTGLAPNTTYTVMVKGFNKANEWSAASVPISVKTLAKVTVPPPPPPPPANTGCQYKSISFATPAETLKWINTNTDKAGLVVNEKMLFYVDGDCTNWMIGCK